MPAVLPIPMRTEGSFHDDDSSPDNQEMNPKKLLVTGGRTAIVAALSKYHPVVIEGMGYYDPRDPIVVGDKVYANLQQHWEQKPTEKPKLVIVQGDPPHDRGISAITPHVTNRLGVSRGLVCLDEHIADYHSPNADRSNVSLEFRYSDLAKILNESNPGTVKKLEERIDHYLQIKNAKRKEIEKPPLKGYFRDFALLQEVTKAACRYICGELTVAHTQNHISEFSVTSFYEIGLEMGLVSDDNMVYFSHEERFDFDTIDKR